MKKLWILLLCLACLAGCSRMQPTPELPSDNDVRVSLRMFVADGALYYDTGYISDKTPRCGTLDGKLTCTTDPFVVPTQDSTCNFTGADGYQNATSITKEVCIEGEGWCIFRKIEEPPSHFSEMPFCTYITGRLPNAKVDTKLYLLTDSLDVTILDVMSPLFSSKFPNEPKYKTYILGDNTAPDAWGLTLTAENVSAVGCTLKYTQLGGTFKGELQTGADYALEKLSDTDTWEAVTTDKPLAWNALAYLIRKNEHTEMQLDWSYGYGALPCGSYRIAKEVTDFIEPGTFEKQTYYAYFDITDEMLCGYPTQN